MANLQNNPYYQAALEYIKNTDLNALPEGKTIIDGDNLFVNIQNKNLKKYGEARLEVHNKYIDIQIPLSCSEQYGITPRSECTQPDGEFNEVKDVLFYNDGYKEVVTLQPNELITFEPDTAHAPMIGEGPIHKAVFKVKVC